MSVKFQSLPEIRRLLSGLSVFALALLIFASFGCGADDEELWEAEPARAGPDLPRRARGAFYYPWFPETWTVGGKCVRYDPLLGTPRVGGRCIKERGYHSDQPNVVAKHVAWMKRAKIDFGIVSWWGKGEHFEGKRVPLLLRTANSRRFKWALYYEKEGFGNPSEGEIANDLRYIRDTKKYVKHYSFARINRKPVMFVYNADDSSCNVVNRWRNAVKKAPGNWFVVMKVFDGYRNCNVRLNGRPFPDSWHQYGAAEGNPWPGYDHQQGYASMVCPGFWQANVSVALLRRNWVRFRNQVRQSVRDGERFQLIVSFNEWGEGTAVEPARQFGLRYIDVLKNNPPR